ncbi:SPFH domain-containing protein [Pseudomonas luteola]
MEYLVLAVIGLFVLVVLAKSFYVVPQGAQYTHERLGQYVDTLRPGLHFMVPFIDRIGHRHSMMEQVLNVPEFSAISKENVTIVVDALAYVQITDAKQASYEVEDPYDAVAALINTTLRSVVGETELDQLLSNRQTINEKLMTVMNDATKPWGIKVTRCEISNLQLPHELSEAMAMQMKAERTKRALVVEASGAKEAAITKAQGERLAKVEKAEGDKEAQVLLAEADLETALKNAEARRAEAEAEAKAIQIVTEAIQSGNQESLNYFLGQKYIDAFNELAKSQSAKYVMMPTEMSSLPGLLSGFAQMVQKKTN